MHIFCALHLRGLLQAPLAQQICPDAPHCWQVPALQISPEPHWVPPQQGWLAPPQATQLPPLQVRPELLQVLFAQQICPEPPQGWQVPPPPQTRPELHWFPAQQG